MRKTWTTRILIALLTLALAAGAVVVAPREARAQIAISPVDVASVDQTITVGESIRMITLQAADVANAASWEWSIINGSLGDLVKANDTTQKNFTISGTPAAGTAGTTVAFTARVVAKNASGGELDAGQINITIQVKKLAVEAKVTSPAVAPTGVKVGANMPSTVFKVTGEPMPDSVTVSGLGDDLSYTYSKATGDVSITGKPAAVGTRKITVTAPNGANAETSFTVGPGDAPAITISPANPSATVNTAITLTADSASDGTFSWTVTNATPATGTGKTFTFTPTGRTAMSVTVTQGVGTNYVANATGTTKSVAVNGQKLTVAIEPPQSGSYAVGSTIYLRGTAPNANDVKWTQSGGANAINADTNLTGASYVVANADLGKTIVFTLTVKDTTGTYSDNSTTASVNIYSNDYVTSPTTSSMTFQTATLYDTKDFNATTFYGGQMRISNSDPNIATVWAGGVEVGSSGVTIANNTKVEVKAKAYGRTYIDVVPLNGNSGNGKRVTVYVGSQTPTLDVQFWSCDYCTTTLTKVNNWGTLKITVDNYNPQYPYVTLTRSNIRTYVQGGSYYSHPSTYTYTAALTQDLTDPLKATATLYIIPQYNGSTHYTAAYTGAVSKNSPTIYVTGYTTLPQTGPDYTWAYVLGGLCLATVATAVTLNVRKKKRESL